MRLSIFICAASVITNCFSAELSSTNEPPPHRLSVNARFGWNNTVRFGGIGHVRRASNPGPATGSDLDRNYDDGYVRRDAGVDNLTWNWGYQHASQVPGDDTLLMHSSSACGGSTTADDRPQSGLEIVLSRALVEFESGRIGVQLGLGYTPIEFRRAGLVRSSATLLTDTYSLGGIIAPNAPYTGHATGPGPVIDDAPVSREVSRTAALTQGRWSLEGDAYALRVGPYCEFDLAPRLTLSLATGLSVAIIDSEFEWREHTMLPGGSSVVSRGSHRNTDALFGGYLEAGLGFALTRQLSWQAGVQFHFLEKTENRTPARSATLNAKTSIMFYSGVGFSF